MTEHVSAGKNEDGGGKRGERDGPIGDSGGDKET